MTTKQLHKILSVLTKFKVQAFKKGNLEVCFKDETTMIKDKVIQAISVGIEADQEEDHEVS